VFTQADLLIMFTDTDGLYDGNPAENPDAKLIDYVPQIDDNIRAIAGGASSKGTGGFITKIKAAELAVNAGIPVVITNGERPTDIYGILKGKNVGTYFEAGKND
jgi:glutamate 5-kinase